MGVEWKLSAQLAGALGLPTASFGAGFVATAALLCMRMCATQRWRPRETGRRVAAQASDTVLMAGGWRADGALQWGAAAGGSTGAALVMVVVMWDTRLVDTHKLGAHMLWRATGMQRWRAAGSASHQLSQTRHQFRVTCTARSYPITPQPESRDKWRRRWWKTELNNNLIIYIRFWQGFWYYVYYFYYYKRSKLCFWK